jgi:ENTS family enterobactin (siderophore) exporter
MLRAALCTSLLVAAAGGLLGPLFVAFSHLRLRATGGQYGLILSAQAVGGITGALLAGRVRHAVGSLRSLMGWTLLSVALVVAALALTTTWWMAALCLAAGGIPTTVSLIATATILQTAPTPGLVGRVNGLFSAVSGLGLAAGALVVGPIVGSVGPTSAVTIDAGIFGAAGLLALLVFPRLPEQDSEVVLHQEVP